MKWPSSKAPARLNLSITSLGRIVSKTLLNDLQCTSMGVPRNLISDSALVQETFDLLSANGGRATFAQIADSVFRLSHAEDQLAASLVADLIRDDPRFTVDRTHLVISHDQPELRRLQEIDF